MSSTLITAATVLAAAILFIIVFIIVHRVNHNKKLAHQKVIFADVVWKHKLEIAEKETINDYLLAIDNINFVLLYINFNKEKEGVKLVDVWNIKSVKVASVDNAVYEHRQGKPVLVDKQVVKLQIEVALLDGDDVDMVLYEYKDGVQDIGLVRDKAEQWCSLINSSIKELPQRAKRLVNQG